MNFVHIAGHIGKDAETRLTSTGRKVTSFSVATNVRNGDKDETIWWRVSAWGDRWEKLAPYLVKGKGVMVGGPIRKPEIYTDHSGNPQVSNLEVWADYVNFAPGGKSDGNTGDQAASSEAAGGFSTPSYGTQNSSPQSEERVPF